MKPQPPAARPSLLERWFGPRRGSPEAPDSAPSTLPGLRGPRRADVRFQALFQQMGDGVLVCDDEGHVLQSNDAADKLFERSADELRGDSLAQLLVRNGKPCQRPDEIVDGAAALRRGQALRNIDLRARKVPEAGCWFVHLRDTAERWEAERRLTLLANYDALTGLPNRALFRDRLERAMARARRTGQAMALMVIDLDRFKIVNESLGHEMGDQLLQHVTRQLQECLRDVDSLSRGASGGDSTLSRLGGDEFTVIAEAVGTAEDAASLARRVLDALSAPWLVDEQEIVVSGSIGITLYPADDVDVDTLLRHTDMAMYRSKSLGRGMYSFFSDDLNAAVSARLSLEGLLRRAAERGEFELHYQPKADLASGRVTGVEALLRWHRPGHGMVPPDRFISVLEDTGLILPVGAWVIRTACRQLAEWDRAGLPPLRMAVNLSACQFRHAYLASLVRDSLAEHAIDGSRLEIELTESLLMEDTEATRTLLASFTQMGVGLAIDDFGTGHSSLSYLKRFNVDTLKIDRSFVSALPEQQEDMAIASAVIALGRSMDMRVVAEGVETQAQADALQVLGCHEMQGWLLGRPMPAETLADWLRKRLEAERARSSLYTSAAISRPMPLTL
ncbi:MAG: EAL domain-containing protein [Rubrivivax sp.]